MGVVNATTLFWLTMVGIAALIAVGFAAYWTFDKRARRRRLAELRARLDAMKPTDPQYAATMALFTAMVIEAYRWSPNADSSAPGSGSSFDSSDGDGGGGD